MGDIHDDLSEVMGLLPCPFCGGHAVVDISSGSDERNGYNFSVAIVCVPCSAKLTRASGYDKNGWCNESVASVTARAITAWNTRPALLARQEGDDRLRDLHHAIRLVYGCVPNLPIDESTMDAATDALHNFCLMVGIHEVDVDSPIDEAARPGGGGSVVKFSDTDGYHYEIHHDPIP